VKNGRHTNDPTENIGEVTTPDLSPQGIGDAAIDALLRITASEPDSIQRHRDQAARYGETISTAFVESTINWVVSKRMVKKQQMRWTKRGAHVLLRARTTTLNGELCDVFCDWYPAMTQTVENLPCPAGLMAAAIGVQVARLGVTMILPQMQTPFRYSGAPPGTNVYTENHTGYLKRFLAGRPSLEWHHSSLDTEQPEYKSGWRGAAPVVELVTLRDREAALLSLANAPLVDAPSVPRPVCALGVQSGAAS